MPSRRTFLAGVTVGVTGLAAPATARPALDRSAATTELDVLGAVDTVAAVSERVTGHLDLAAVEALRDVDLESLDRRTAADLDRRLAPVLGRGPGRVAGLRTLAGALDAEAVAARLATGVASEGTRLLADLGPTTVSTPDTSFDADAVTAVSVTEGELGAVESFALGVDVDGSFWARVDGDGVSVADARGVLRAVGLPASVVDGLPPVARAEYVEFHGSFERTDGEQPFVVALLLVLLAAVVGTFVLGIEGGGGGAPRVPQVAFEYEYDSGGPVTIVHTGGDHVPSSELLVEYTTEGRRRGERWADEDGVVQAGDDHTTVRAPDPGTDLRVVWESPDGSTSATLGLFRVPE
ncbi:type IV pilin [Salinirubellus salinus]|uniref:Type IV pilin n=1 Tax=Salinirubellus salinus TaxID=1364945 RepID=A0A9E7R6E4_9EURY|nr:type IV pilin [Salinirubellus salinus]UWM55525.1 type IV pilin [Salinirubellus salinus]